MKNGMAVNDLLKKAFDAGRNYEYGECESEETYNKFTGFQKPNERPTFDEWLKELYKDN